MSAPKSRKPAGETASPETAEANQESQRFHEYAGQLYPIVRTYFDTKQNIVMDVYEVTKTVVTKHGEREVKLLKHERSNDEALQMKHRRGTNNQVEVNFDV